MGYNAYTHGNVTRKLPVQLSLKKSFFFFYKIEEREGRTGPDWGVGTSLGGGGKVL
jgi:hypothetical protein